MVGVGGGGDVDEVVGGGEHCWWWIGWWGGIVVDVVCGLGGERREGRFGFYNGGLLNLGWWWKRYM